MRFVTPENKHLATPEAVDLMDKLLRYDHVVRWKGGDVMYRLVISNRFVSLHTTRLTALLILTTASLLTITFIIAITTATAQERLTAQEAMAHPFFDAVRKNREAGGAAAGKAAEGSM